MPRAAPWLCDMRNTNLLNKNGLLPPGLKEATALTKRYRVILQDAALKTLAHIKKRDLILANLMLDVALQVQQRMHNAPPQEIAEYINTRLDAAGFDTHVSVSE